MFNANFCGKKKRCVSLQVISEYSCWGFSVGYAISAKCFEEEESNKLPYFGSFSSVYSCAALVDLKIAQRQTFKKQSAFEAENCFSAAWSKGQDLTGGQGFVTM